jgi:hypothetical protein
MTAASRNEGVGVNLLRGWWQQYPGAVGLLYTVPEMRNGIWCEWVHCFWEGVCFQVTTYGFLHTTLKKVCPVRGQGPACGSPVCVMRPAATFVNSLGVCVCVCMCTHCRNYTIIYALRYCDFYAWARGAAVNNGCDPLPEESGLLARKVQQEYTGTGRLNFARCRLIFVGTLYETHCMSPFMRLEFWCASKVFGKFVHLCISLRVTLRKVYTCHIFLASWWVGACCSAIYIGLYSCSGLNMSLQNVRGSVITARSVTTPYLFWGRLKAVSPWLGWHLLFQHVFFFYRGGAEISFQKVLHGDISPCSRVVRSWLSFMWSQNYPRFRGNLLLSHLNPIRTFTPYLFKPILMLSFWVFQRRVRAVLRIVNETITPRVQVRRVSCPLTIYSFKQHTKVMKNSWGTRSKQQQS